MLSKQRFKQLLLPGRTGFQPLQHEAKRSGFCYFLPACHAANALTLLRASVSFPCLSTLCLSPKSLQSCPFMFMKRSSVAVGLLSFLRARNFLCAAAMPWCYVSAGPRLGTIIVQFCSSMVHGFLPWSSKFTTFFTIGSAVSYKTLIVLCTKQTPYYV